MAAQMRNRSLPVFRVGNYSRLCGVIGVLLLAEADCPARADGTAYYANTCSERESGDIAGYVVIVSDGEPRPSISLSWSEGALMLPVASKIMDYDRASGRLAFSVHNEGGDFIFKGKLAPQRIDGIFTVPWKSRPEHVELEIRSRKLAFEPDAECQ